jgi:serine/threonine protein phosphatase PrpC
MSDDDDDLALSSVSRTHVGRVRTLNEDNFVDRSDVGIWAVADGMGGHDAGEVASGMLAQVLGHVDDRSTGYSFLDDVKSSIYDVNQQLIARAEAGDGAIIGSTIVALLAYQGFFACLWAGDSRAYLLREFDFIRLSRDHSVVQEMIDSGQLTVEEAKNYGRSNVITRAVGVSADLELELNHGKILPGDRFLLCSDGLTGMVEDEEMREILLRYEPEAAADLLLETTLERGAKDNVTFIIISVDPALDDTTLNRTQTQYFD